MKTTHRVCALIIGTSLILSSFSPSVFAEEQRGPTVIFSPSPVTPGSAVTAQVSGFTPQSTITISHMGKTDGINAHIIGMHFNEPQRKTDDQGATTFTVGSSELDYGAITFGFTDEKGLTAQGTFTVRGSAPRRLLYGAEVLVTEENIQVGITGVGWLPGSKKVVTAFDPDEKHYTPELIDLCGGMACEERQDGLKLGLLLPRSTEAGIHKLRVEQEGGSAVETTMTIPELPENQEHKKQKASIFLIDPPAATVDITSIVVRGKGWGPYNNRRNLQAWLVDPEGEVMHELKVDRNYRDCGFIKGDTSITGKCLLESDELFLRLEIPKDIQPKLKPQQYLVYVRTEKKVDAGGVFTILETPLLDKTKGEVITSIPRSGPTGTYTVLFGAGFPKKQSLDVRFDGVRLSLGGVLWPEDDGSFQNIGFFIPTTITRDKKIISITPGSHTIEVSNGNALARTSFIVDGSAEDKKKMDEEKLKKEREEKERVEKERKEKEQLQKEEEKLKKEQERVKKEEERLEKERKELEKKLNQKREEEKKKKEDDEKVRLEKERKELEKKLEKKKEDEKKKEERLEDIAERRDEIKDRFCDPNVPITFQPGCLSKKPLPQKSEFVGKACRADLAITLQTGCIAQDKEEQKQVFEGKPCSRDIPSIWQEGCIPHPKLDENNIFTGKSCRADLAIVFQPGCIPQPRSEGMSDYGSIACRANISTVFQPGCIDPKIKTGYSPAGKQYCDPRIPSYTQPGCASQPQLEQKKSFTGKTCDPALPKYWQEGCDDPSIKTGIAPSGKTYCMPNIPEYNQPGCEPQSRPVQTPLQSSPVQQCNPNIPEYNQPWCIK